MNATVSLRKSHAIPSSTPSSRPGGEEVVDGRAAGGYVARAELVLGQRAHKSLGAIPLSPDPLQLVAAAMARVQTRQGEDLQLAIDVLPVSDEHAARRRRRLLKRAARRGPQAFGEQLPGSRGGSAGGTGGRMWEDVVASLNGGKTPGPAASGVGGRERTPRQADVSEGVGKLLPGAEVFAVQVLIRAAARHPVRAKVLLHQALAAVTATGQGENWWRPAGPRRWWRAYSNTWWRRRGFDRRWRTGEFGRMRRRQWVTVPEIAAWLRPPTRTCAAQNVRRGGGSVPPAPAELETWEGQPGVVPHGLAVGADGRQRLVATPSDQVLFAANLGQSGYGKTELALVQALALAYDRQGVWFLDPHGEALQRARPYLAHPAIAERLWEIDLADPRQESMMASWNPLDMRGRRVEEIQEVVGAVVGGFATTQGWGSGAPRARAILSQATLLLAEFAYHRCQLGASERQPTLFQIKPLLLDDDWRDELLACLPAPVAARARRFWQGTFPRYGVDAATVVVNALERMETSLSLRGFFGSPCSSYSARTAMDGSKVVFVCPSGSGEGDQLVTSLLLFDLFRAGLSRRDIPRARRRTQWAFVDEMTAVDGGASGQIPMILEQLRKYEVRLVGATQMLLRLSPETRLALLQNQSLLSSTRADPDEAAVLAKRLRGADAATAIEELQKYEYLTSTTLNGRRTPPFRVRGVPIDEVYADYYRPEGVPALRAAVDHNLNRRPLGEILAELDTLDDTLLTPTADSASAASAPNSPGAFDLSPGGAA